MKCSNCGNHLNDNDNFCGNCGNKVEINIKKGNKIANTLSYISFILMNWFAVIFFSSALIDDLFISFFGIEPSFDILSLFYGFGFIFVAISPPLAFVIIIFTRIKYRYNELSKKVLYILLSEVAIVIFLFIYLVIACELSDYSCQGMIYNFMW